MPKTVTCFGSSMGVAGEPMYEAMREVGSLLASRGVTVLTGGHGGSGMEAPAKGAQDAGGKCIGYTLERSRGNAFLGEIADCSLLAQHTSLPHANYGIRLAALLTADGFIFGAGGGAGALVELAAVIQFNRKVWGAARRIAILKPGSVAPQMNGWDETMLDTLTYWGVLDTNGRKYVAVVDRPHEAVNWVLR